MVNIEEGKFYRTRRGEMIGPIERTLLPFSTWPWMCGEMYYKPIGHSCPGIADDHDDADDLVAEWIDTDAAAKSAVEGN